MHRSRAPPTRADADAFTEGLNPDQLDAVVHGDGPLLVVAGAGSGKTRVLTHRIAHLIDEGVHPSRILAITFTNKAADEMRQRVAALDRPGRPHDVGVHVPLGVRAHPAAPTPTGSATRARSRSTTRPTAVRLTGYVIRDLHLDAKRFTPRGVHGAISLWKNELVDPGTAAAGAQHIFERKHAEVYREYQDRLLQGGGDGLRRPAAQHGASCSASTPTCSSTTASASSTSSSTSTRTPTRPRTRSSSCSPAATTTSRVVGDTDQSVYRFRGADFRNIVQFEDAFPDGHDDRARPELPQHADDPRRRQRGDRQQPGAQAEEPVDRRRHRRPHRALPRRGRGRRGHVRRLARPASCTTTTP